MKSYYDKDRREEAADMTSPDPAPKVVTERPDAWPFPTSRPAEPSKEDEIWCRICDWLRNRMAQGEV